MTGYRQLARNRDFTILWVGETISTLGSRMSLFVFPLMAYALSGSTLTAALVEAVQLVGLCAMLLPAGVWADRFHRRTLMLASSATGVLAYGSLTVAGVLGHLTVPHLGIVALVTGAATGVFQPAQMSAIRAVVPTADLPTALSQNQAREHVAGLLGGPLGGALYAVARWLPFAVDAVSYLVSCFTLTRVRADLSASPRSGSRPAMHTQLAEGLRFIWGRPFFRVLLSWASLTNLVSNAVFFVVLMRLIQLGYPPVQIGLIETAAGLGGIIGALAAPYLIDRVPTGRLTLTVAWMCVLPLVPLLWWLTPLSAVVAVFALLLINPAGNAGIGAYRVAVTPDDLQGRVSATSQFLAMSVMPLSPLLGGWLLEHLGGAPAVAILIAASAVLALFISSSRSVRAVPRPRDWVADDRPAPVLPVA
ncbi:MAG: MFS transporter [Nocardioidaceae bacterium]|nr:MFS transporter [Nocardioidaceae bacterium]